MPILARISLETQPSSLHQGISTSGRAFTRTMANAPGLKYVILDVFTTKRFAGNPLAIVQLDSAASLSQDQKHQITKEFNLSETVFLHPEMQEGERRIDIFTPSAELPFAGRRSIGV